MSKVIIVNQGDDGRTLVSMLTEEGGEHVGYMGYDLPDILNTVEGFLNDTLECERLNISQHPPL